VLSMNETVSLAQVQRENGGSHASVQSVAGCHVGDRLDTQTSSPRAPSLHWHVIHLAKALARYLSSSPECIGRQVSAITLCALSPQTPVTLWADAAGMIATFVLDAHD